LSEGDVIPIKVNLLEAVSLLILKFLSYNYMYEPSCIDDRSWVHRLCI